MLLQGTRARLRHSHQKNKIKMCVNNVISSNLTQCYPPDIDIPIIVLAVQ